MCCLIQSSWSVNVRYVFCWTKVVHLLQRKKALPLHAKLTQKGRISTAVSVLNPDAKRRGGWLAKRADHLTPGEKHPIPISHEVVWTSRLVWMGPENPAPPCFEPRTPISATSRYPTTQSRPPVHLKYFYKVPITGGKKKSPKFCKKHPGSAVPCQRTKSVMDIKKIRVH